MLLLDEIEKAHPDVFNILLQVLDDGRLTDSQGRTVDFKNTVIVMTSNLGSDVIQDLTKDKSLDAIAVGSDIIPEDGVSAARYTAIKQAVMNVVSTHFRPEFINRIDETVVFHPLAQSHVRGIAKIQIDLLRKRLQAQDIDLVFTPAALDKLGETGFDPVFGARPLKRTIQQEVENSLAQRLLAGEFLAGESIAVDWDATKNCFAFQKVAVN